MLVAHEVALSYEEALRGRGQRFNELGALQFEQDVRLLCEGLETLAPPPDTEAQRQQLQGLAPPCPSPPDGRGGAEEEGGGGEAGAEADACRARVRGEFGRLRHWAFLVGLGSPLDLISLPYPTSALTGPEVRTALLSRIGFSPDEVAKLGDAVL